MINLVPLTLSSYYNNRKEKQITTKNVNYEFLLSQRKWITFLNIFCIFSTHLAENENRPYQNLRYHACKK